MSNGGQPRSSSSFHFAAGLLTGTISASLLQPADLLKTRIQQTSSSSLLPTLRAILSGPSPISQLWRGTLPSCIRTGLGSALYFSTLNALRQNVASSKLFTSTGLVPTSSPHPKFSSSSLPQLSNTANLTTGAIARVSAGFVMTPVTVIKVRYESTLYAYKSLWGATSAIIGTEGFKGFFSGFGATAIRDAPYAGLYVLFYEQMKRRLSGLQDVAARPLLPGALRLVPSSGSESKSSGSSVSINFVSGVLAAGLATTITNPFDAVKTRLQLMPGKYGNLLKAARRMVQEDGARSLFDGLGLRMGRKAISSALSWTLYEEMIRRAELRWDDKASQVI